MKNSFATILIVLVSLADMSLSQVSLAATAADQVQVAGEKSNGRFERLDVVTEKSDDSETWSCVADRQTGLVWEVKTVDGGKRDTGNSYSWFDPELGSQAGVADGGHCSGGVKCDTHHYQVSLNQERLCGYDDWRLPSREELETLVKFQANKSVATIDQKLFPDAAASWYWTASSNRGNPNYAWYVLFRNGIPLNDLKARPKHVRLVRGGKLPVASKQ